MNPAPRPPSPTQRDATQKALRRENPNQLSSRDARILMGLPSGQTGSDLANIDKTQDNPYIAIDTIPAAMPVNEEPSVATTNAPPRPSRESRQGSVPLFDAVGPSHTFPNFHRI